MVQRMQKPRERNLGGHEQVLEISYNFMVKAPSSIFATSQFCVHVRTDIGNKSVPGVMLGFEGCRTASAF